MIIGHGIDLVDLKRFQKMDSNRLRRLALRICTESELNEYINHPIKYQYLAKIWASKEAVSKAFGTGIRNNITWKAIEVKSDELGCPRVNLKFDIENNFVCYLSISHDKGMLISSVILENV